MSAFLPFPTEIASSSTMLPCFDQQQLDLVLSNAESQLADYLGTLLSDTTDQLRKMFEKRWNKRKNRFEKSLNVPSNFK